MDVERAKLPLVLLGVPLVFVLAVVVAFAAWAGRPDTEPTEWERSEVDGAEVQVTYTGSACQDDAWIEAEEGEDRVVLTVMTSEDAGSCPAIGVLYTLTTTLDAPLGDRELVDGAS